MVRTQVQLTEEQMEQLRSAADREGVSLAEVIRRLIDQTLRGHAVPKAELKRRALEAAGRFSSGRSDISAEHDRHLEKAFRE